MKQNEDTYEYQYFLKDHLGNTRISLSQNGNVLQEDTYYPYGMNIKGLSYSNSCSENKYKYNGKRCTERSRSELQDEFGLEWYDYGARMYDAGLGRWFVLDMLSEEFYSFSCYNYATNNPIVFIDPDGNGIFPTLTSLIAAGNEAIKKYPKNGETTYCNIGVQYILNQAGDYSLGDYEINDYTANQMGWKLRGAVGKYVNNNFATPVNEKNAIYYAKKGITVIASYVSNDGSGEKPGKFGGHIAVVSPKSEDEVLVMNVGKINKVGTISQTFGSKSSPQFFILNKDKTAVDDRPSRPKSNMYLNNQSSDKNPLSFINLIMIIIKNQVFGKNVTQSPSQNSSSNDEMVVQEGWWFDFTKGGRFDDGDIE